MQDFVEYGNSKIEFKIKRSGRKTLGISVLPSGAIEVTAPNDVQVEKIRELIIKRGAWLLEQRRLTNFNPILQPRKQFISGESFFLLGRQYRLKVFESNYDSVDLLDDRIILNCTFPDDFELKNKLMLSWYSQKASAFLVQRFKEKALSFNQENIHVSVKKLSKNWGEYHPSKKSVILNLELIVAPVECIDYVIVHELCHAEVLNHGVEFYDLLKSRLPNWNALKNLLEYNSNGLLAIFPD